MSTASSPARPGDALQRWAANLTGALDHAIDDPRVPAFRREPEIELKLDTTGTTANFTYRRRGVAFDLLVVAHASVGFVGVRCPLVAGGGAEDGRGTASLEIAVVRNSERNAATYRYGLHPFNARVTIDRRHFREAVKALVRSAGFFVE